jgi:hypothetical protein
VHRQPPADSGEEAVVFEDYGWLAWLGVAIALGAIEAATVAHSAKRTERGRAGIPPV